VNRSRAIHIRVKIALNKIMYDSEDPHSRNLFEETWYDVSLSWSQQFGNQVAIAYTPGYSYA
jgi:hypothetical protein